jgi:hypothetical protein
LIFFLLAAAAVLLFFIAGLLYLLRFERVDNLGAYSIPSGDRPSHPICSQQLSCFELSNPTNLLITLVSLKDLALRRGRRKLGRAPRLRKLKNDGLQVDLAAKHTREPDNPEAEHD